MSFFSRTDKIVSYIKLLDPSPNKAVLLKVMFIQKAYGIWKINILCVYYKVIKRRCLFITFIYIKQNHEYDTYIIYISVFQLGWEKGRVQNWTQSSARTTKIRAQFSARTTHNRAQFRARMTKIWSQSST